jgi:hypothetical protein
MEEETRSTLVTVTSQWLMFLDPVELCRRGYSCLFVFVPF